MHPLHVCIQAHQQHSKAATTTYPPALIYAYVAWVDPSKPSPSRACDQPCHDVLPHTVLQINNTSVLALFAHACRAPSTKHPATKPQQHHRVLCNIVFLSLATHSFVGGLPAIPTHWTCCATLCFCRYTQSEFASMHTSHSLVICGSTHTICTHEVPSCIVGQPKCSLEHISNVCMRRGFRARYTFNAGYQP